MSCACKTFSAALEYTNIFTYNMLYTYISQIVAHREIKVHIKKQAVCERMTIMNVLLILLERHDQPGWYLLCFLRYITFALLS